MYYYRGEKVKDGGEGYIFKVQNHSELLMKIYKEADPRGEVIVTPELIRKLEFMKSNPPGELVAQGVLAWPIELIYGQTKLIGFVMPKLTFDSQILQMYAYKHPIYDPLDYPKFPSVKSRIQIAVNLTYTLQKLHDSNYIVGDLNHENIGLNRNTGQINIVDCDSFHITDQSGNIMRTNVIMPGYLAPEIIAHCNSERAKGKPYNLDKVSLPTFTKETDLFCLAIHIFKLLMNGVDPFRGVLVNTTGSAASPFQGNDAIERNAYVFKKGMKPSAAFCLESSDVPKEIKELFEKAFVDGHTDPFARPSAEVWYYALIRYMNLLRPCLTNTAKHQYFKELWNCPFCEADKRHAEVQSSLSPPVLVKHPAKKSNSSKPTIPQSSSSQSSSSRSSPAIPSWAWVGEKLIPALILLFILIIAAYSIVYSIYVNNAYATLYDESAYNVLFLKGESEHVDIVTNFPLSDRKSFILSTKDASIVAVENWYLKSQKEGSTEVFMLSEDGDLYDSEKWYVLVWHPHATIIHLQYGENYDLFGQLSPDMIQLLYRERSVNLRNVIQTLVTFSTSESSVLVVDEKGIVTAVGKGSATVFVEEGENILQTYGFSVSA